MHAEGICGTLVLSHGSLDTGWSCFTDTSYDMKMGRECSSGAQVASCMCIRLTSGPACLVWIRQQPECNARMDAIAARFADIHEEYLTDWSLLRLPGYT